VSFMFSAQSTWHAMIETVLSASAVRRVGRTGSKIRVNSMSPGVIDSGASAASDDSRYTTAIDLVVDGGLANV
jgi:NAD(P)-dependent dehydrogenase (short-subunit alcohol dehydrogenase family)